MRRFFAFLFSLIASGCYISHERPVSVIPTRDSGPIVRDAGPVPVTDVGPDTGDGGSVMPDAGGPFLRVSLASDSPEKRLHTSNGTGVLLASFSFEYVAEPGPVTATISHLSIHRTGIGSASDYTNVYLYNGAFGHRMSLGHRINPVTGMIEFNDIELLVLTGGRNELALRGDLPGGGAIPSGEHVFEIVSAEAVSTREGIPVSGTFPVRSRIMTIGVSAVGRVDLLAGTQPPDPVSGALGAEISNFVMRSGANEVEPELLILNQEGTYWIGELGNVGLYVGSELVATGGPETTRYTQIVLHFVPGYRLPPRTDTTCSLRADIMGPAGRTIRTYVEYPTDVRATDTLYNAEAAVCISPDAIGGCPDVALGSFDGSSSATYIEVTVR